MYSKYLEAREKKPSKFQQQKKQYKSTILTIVDQLLCVGDEYNETEGLDDEGLDDKELEKSNNDENNKNNSEIILHPNVINMFDDFVRFCIENIQDFEESNKEDRKEEEIAPFFTEEEDKNV